MSGIINVKGAGIAKKILTKIKDRPLDGQVSKEGGSKFREMKNHNQNGQREVVRAGEWRISSDV